MNSESEFYVGYLPMPGAANPSEHGLLVVNHEYTNEELMFAGLALSQLLARASRPDAALGSNLLGTVFGGCIEYLSVVTGLRALTLIAIALYAAAFLFIHKANDRTIRDMV